MNGTSALVFLCEGTRGVKSLLNLFDDNLREKVMRKWNDFLDNSENERKKFYVKVKTASTEGSVFWCAYSAFSTEWGFDALKFWAAFMHVNTSPERIPGFLETYPVCPVVKGNGNCYVVLMNDRGQRL
jgi:hypothetical protein